MLQYVGKTLYWNYCSCLLTKRTHDVFLNVGKTCYTNTKYRKYWKLWFNKNVFKIWHNQKSRCNFLLISSKFMFLLLLKNDFTCDWNGQIDNSYILNGETKRPKSNFASF